MSWVSFPASVNLSSAHIIIGALGHVQTFCLCVQASCPLCQISFNHCYWLFLITAFLVSSQSVNTFAVKVIRPAPSVRSIRQIWLSAMWRLFPQDVPVQCWDNAAYPVWRSSSAALLMTFILNTLITCVHQPCKLDFKSKLEFANFFKEIIWNFSAIDNNTLFFSLLLMLHWTRSAICGIL